MSVSSEESLLDVRGMPCPMPVVNARRAIRGLEPGATLRVVSDDRRTLKDFKGWARLERRVELVSQDQEELDGLEVFVHLLQVTSVEPLRPDAPVTGPAKDATMPGSELDGSKLFTTESDQRKLIARLARVEGQLRGIQKMLERGEDCEKVAQQMAAARGALSKAFLELFACAFETKLGGAAEVDPSLREGLSDLSELLSKYA